MNHHHEEHKMNKNHQGRIYFATEYAIRPEDIEIVETEILANKQVKKVKREKMREGAEYSPGYRAVIWNKDGSGIVWSHEMPKAKMDTTPELAYSRLRQKALDLGVPVDLWTNLGEFVETVNA